MIAETMRSEWTLPMKQISTWGYGGLAVLALILSPVVVILALPLAIGIGLDLFDAAGKGPIVVLLCVPLGVTVLRRLSVGAASRRAIGYLWSRVHISAAANLIHSL